MRTIGESAGVAATNASAAGVLDALCGGHAHFAGARAVARELAATSPLLVAGLRTCREFHTLAAVRATRSGVTQFIDAGCGLLGARPLHTVVDRRGFRRTRTVYLNPDPAVVAYLDTIAGPGTGVVAIRGNVDSPEQALAHDRVRAVIDPGQPACLILGTAPAHVPDDDHAAATLARWANILAPGSRLVLVHPHAAECGPEADALRAAARIFERATGTPLLLRSKTVIQSWLTAWDVEAPGVGPVNAWRPALLRGRSLPVLGAVATLTGPGQATDE